MLGAASGLQFNKSRNGDDRFYSVSRGRMNKKNDHHRDLSSSRPSTEVCKQVAGPTVEPAASCNLERFLESVTPTVPAQYLSKMTIKSWRTCDVEYQPYFVLSDLWESFKEWSAYGVGVPLTMNGSDNIVQYYVPYLSGVQLYADLSKSAKKPSRLGEESDIESSPDSSSDQSSDSEQDRGDGLNHYRQKLNHPQTNNDSSLRDQAFQEGFSSDEGESGNSLGCLLFEYLARDQPYCREPLADKISDLSRHFPQLKTLRSCDLLPSSWLSVAWYPIYRIPTGPTLKDLDACFLTFHSLHTQVTGREVVPPPIVTYKDKGNGEGVVVPEISLPVFGLASYKYKASLWTPNMGRQLELANCLLQAADNWLNLVRVDHPDFSFFCRR